jgi:uncharacterized protein YecE (DUF72 family)
MRWHIGCSGFHYKEWKEVFYPAGLPQSKWFDHYSSLFDTLEINFTFYRFPQLAFLQNWHKKSPPHFLFALKVPRLITHFKKFVDVERMLSDFYGTARNGLKEKVGPILFQLPPGMEFSEEKMEQIIASVDDSFVNVVECRHASWWNKKVYNAFKKNNICFCSISYPNLPTDVVATTETIYYRFHGMPKLYYSAYTEKVLKDVADAIRKKKKKTAFIYFNNTAGTGAIENAEYILEYATAKKLFPVNAS